MYITLPLWWGVCGNTPSPLPYPPLYMCFGGVLGGIIPSIKFSRKNFYNMTPYPVKCVGTKNKIFGKIWYLYIKLLIWENL